MSNREPLAGREVLWRRIHRSQLNDGKVSSAAFYDDEMSVDISRIQREMTTTLSEGVGVAEFRASAAQALGLKTVADPQSGNAAHALVIGKKTKSIRRKLRDAATFTTREQILSTRADGRQSTKIT